MHGTVWWMETLSLTAADLETKISFEGTEINTRFISQCIVYRCHVIFCSGC